MGQLRPPCCTLPACCSFAITTYELARRFARGASPWLAVALLVTIPTVIWEASTAYIDLALMLFVTLAFYTLLRYIESSRRQWLLLAALNLGLALASKHLALFALVLFCAGLLLALRRQGVGWRTALMAVLVLVVTEFAVGAAVVLAKLCCQRQSGLREAIRRIWHPPERWNMATETGLRALLGSVWPVTHIAEPADIALAHDNTCR